MSKSVSASVGEYIFPEVSGARGVRFPWGAERGLMLWWCVFVRIAASRRHHAGLEAPTASGLYVARDVLFQGT